MIAKNVRVMIDSERNLLIRMDLHEGEKLGTVDAYTQQKPIFQDQGLTFVNVQTGGLELPEKSAKNYRDQTITVTDFVRSERLIELLNLHAEGLLALGLLGEDFEVD